MTWLEALFRVQPGVGWLLLAALLFSAELASARLRFAWAALAALAPALLAALGCKLEREAEIALFAALTAAANLLSARERKVVVAQAPRPAAPHGLPTPRADTPDPPRRRARADVDESKSSAALLRDLKRRQPEPAGPTPADPRRAIGLVGETAQTLTEFSNGVGRIWLGGAEWGAELVGCEALAPDTPVEVVGVSGGVRLQVRALAA